MPGGKVIVRSKAHGARVAVRGQLERGNIDMTKRPAVRNPDGSVSSVRSISVREDDREVLIPTVVGNRVVTNREAVDEYRRTGKHLGKFSDVDSANKHAEALHKSEAAKIKVKR